MSVIFVVLPLAVLFSIVAVGLFLWAARDGQFDDLQTPALRILQDDSRAHATAARRRSSGAGFTQVVGGSSPSSPLDAARPLQND
jgi:cbb3-type cytochrome oxidase maturation protein